MTALRSAPVFINIKIDKFFDKSYMVFQWIKQEWFRYLIFNIHDINHKDKSNIRKKGRMIYYGYLDIHN